MSKFNYFDGNKHNARDRMMSEVGEAMEGNILSAFKRVRFKGVILNGFETGMVKTAPDQFLFNAPRIVKMADGMTRWKLKFTIHEDFYDTNIGNAFTAYFGSSPLEKITPAQMHERIDRMPFAYTDVSDSNYSKLHFGATVNIYERFGFFFISSPAGTGVSPQTTTGEDGTIDDYLNGKKYNLSATHYDSQIENLPPDYWVDILHKVIAEGRAHNPKACKTGKTYKDFCVNVDGGNVGIAHFANRSLNSLLARMIKDPPNGYGKAKIEEWFGQPIDKLKQVFPKCYMPYNGKQRAGTVECSKRFSWYVKGWRSFVAEYDKGGAAKDLMIKVQQNTYRDTKVKKAEAIAKKHNYPTNMRNMAIILGIINSYGSWGNFRGKNPEDALNHYVKLKPGKHRAGRAKLIRDNYPIKKSTPVGNFGKGPSNPPKKNKK